MECHRVGMSSISSRHGRLKDLLWLHDKLFVLTDTGLWYSRNEGADWGVVETVESSKAWLPSKMAEVILEGCRSTAIFGDHTMKAPIGGT